MELEQLAVKITGDSQSLQDALSEGVESIEVFGVKVGDLGKILGVAGLAGFAMEATKAIGEMIGEFAEDETAQLKFNAAMAATGLITEQGAQALGDYAEKFATMAGIANSEAQTMLATLAATGRTREEIEKMTTAALGLSNATGVSLDTALQQINMTFSGTSGRLNRLTPELNELTKEQLINGDAVDILLEKYGKFSDVLVNSSDVSIKNYNNAIGELKSSLGQLAEQKVKPVRDWLTDLATGLLDTDTQLAAFARGFNSVVEFFATGFVTPFLYGAKIVVEGFVDMNDAVTGGINAITDAGIATSVELAAVEESQKRIEAGEKAAIDRWVAMGEAYAASTKTQTEAEAKQIEGRKKGEEEYRDAITQTEALISSGIYTETEGVKKKIEANEKLKDKLIELGYTGAKESAFIGDKSLREANARIEALSGAEDAANQAAAAAMWEQANQEREVAEWGMAYLEAKEAAESEAARQTLERTLEQANQEREVAEWSMAYLEAKEAAESDAARQTSERIAEEYYQNTEVAAWEADYLAEKALAATDSETEITQMRKEQAEIRKAIVKDTSDTEIAAAELAAKTWEDAGAKMLKSIGDVARTAYLEAMEKLGESLGSGATALDAMGTALGNFAMSIMKAMPQILLELALAVMPVNPIAGVALVLASGLVAGVNAFAETEQGKSVSDTIGQGAKDVGNFLLGWTGIKFADGTESAPGGKALVGEHGPELVDIPRGSKVIPAGETSAMLSGSKGSSLQFVFNSPVALDAGESETKFRRAVRELAFEGVLA